MELWWNSKYREYWQLSKNAMTGKWSKLKNIYTDGIKDQGKPDQN